VREILIGILVGSVGCAAGKPSVVYKGISDASMRVEERSLPARPDATPLSDAANTSYPLIKGSSAPVNGLLVTEEKAARILRLKAAYDELRSLYESDRTVFKQNRLIYEERIQAANAEIARLAPSWWDDNKGTIGFIGGIVLGAAVTVGISAGVNAAK